MVLCDKEVFEIHAWIPFKGNYPLALSAKAENQATGWISLPCMPRHYSFYNWQNWFNLWFRLTYIVYLDFRLSTRMQEVRNLYSRYSQRICYFSTNLSPLRCQWLFSIPQQQIIFFPQLKLYNLFGCQYWMGRDPKRIVYSGYSPP